MKISYYRHNKFNNTPNVIKKGAMNYNELTFVLKGCLNYFLGGESITVNEGDCIYVSKGCIRERRSSTLSDYVSFNFHGEVDGNLPVLIKDCVNSDVNQLITVCDSIYRKYSTWSTIMDGTLNTIIKLLQERAANREEHPMVIKIKRYVRANLSRKITLDDIAKEVGYSPNYCDALFKTYSGESLMNYVINARIAEAKLLLTEGVLSLKQVAESTGFEDYNYFSRLFKQKTNYTPREYKNKS